MIGIVGIVIVFVMVFGGYVIAGGKLGIILHSAALRDDDDRAARRSAPSSSATTRHGIKHTLKDVGKVFKGPHWKPQDYQDLLCLMFQLIRIARQNPVELDQHIEDPGASSIFGGLSAHPRRQRGGRADLRHAALGLDELRRSAPGRGGARQAHRGELRQRAAFGAHAADHGRRPARARHRRRRARRHQDDGLDRPAAGDPRQDDRRRAGRDLPRRVPRLRLRRPVRQPGEGGDRRGPAFLQPDPRGDGRRPAPARPEHLRRGRPAEHARRASARATTRSRKRCAPPSRASRHDPRDAGGDRGPGGAGRPARPSRRKAARSAPASTTASPAS